ncbi:Folylpolyglutamate synthetase [Gnomoniopsis smithogilvyi]|uniref:MICOS complex subunit MIC60 n=1 Tax=Gnomoniopsis smithogilvyi TaxID=1191159 RepID=A0A9W8Z6R3_9PEZI|nr:Folylpolyglutamate synthetase [Gnomoniopsis smithogilvyi]
MPALETNTTPSTQPPPPASEANVEAKTIAAENVPLTPPAPEDLGQVTKNEGSQIATPLPPPPAGKGFFRRLRNYVLTLVILGAVAFGGGVYYSRINDSFHDFFTEFVPYGEQAVLYLEEMEFRKRFPNISNRGGPQRGRGDTGEAVKIPAQSGVAWRVADAGEPAGRQSNAADKTEKVKQIAKAKAPEPKEVPPKPKEQSAPAAVEPKKAAPASVDAATTGFKTPEVNEPSRLPPPAPLQPVYFPGVDEPVVQDLAHMLNDIIAVINADGAHAKYSSAIDKAKNELQKVYKEIDQIKAEAEKNAAAQVKERVDVFDKAANDLLTRVETTMAAQEAGWQREFDEEMRKIKDTYESRIKVMTERERELSEKRLGNKMLEQALELKRQFTKQIKDQVEKERDSRLGRLDELSKSVSNLEKLAAGWNEVVDMNLRTQQLHVAVEAVRASLEDAAHPRPFIKELVALKEIAADDSVVNAAIASINPVAYQRGVSNSAELIDRFRRVAAEVRKASLLPEDAGVASHASSFVLSKVLFKKQGLAAGDDVESILTRTQTFLEEGDLDGAAREMNGLTGWAKTLSRDWLGEVRKVLEVRQALEVSLTLHPQQQDLQTEATDTIEQVIQTEARLQSLKVE